VAPARVPVREPKSEQGSEADVSVVVNEWEVVPEAAPPAGGPNPPPAPEKPPASSQTDLERSIRQLLERSLRLGAD
jgi:hypothetical protein